MTLRACAMPGCTEQERAPYCVVCEHHWRELPPDLQVKRTESSIRAWVSRYVTREIARYLSLSMAACVGKAVFDSFELAESVARRMRQRHHDDAPHVRPYSCPHCGHIHIGAKKRKRRRNSPERDPA